LVNFHFILEEIRGEHQFSPGYGHQVRKVRLGQQADFAHSSLWQGQAGHHLEQHSGFAVSFQLLSWI
jgi:hypothetical protein